MYQWNKDEEDLIEKKKKKKKKKQLVLLLKCRQPTCHMDKPVRQLNRSGMVTQGRASVVDTAMESSHLKHQNCIYSSIYIYVHETMQTTKKKEKREREIQVLYILPHIQPDWCAGDMPRRGECKGAH